MAKSGIYAASGRRCNENMYDRFYGMVCELLLERTGKIQIYIIFVGGSWTSGCIDIRYIFKSEQLSDTSAHGIRSDIYRWKTS